ncbi:hypothetical protein [Dyella sp.]|uniref:hypothetical protein n=1 Tax=Dyella sp. TaxID=1869338 RepID=UPI002ED26EF7
MTSAPGIRFDYRPSRVPLGLAMSGSCLVVVAMSISHLSWPIRLLVIAMALVAQATSVLRSADRQVRQVQWTSDDAWLLRMKDGRELTATLRHFRVQGGQIILNLVLAGRHGPLTLWLAPDNAQESIRRQLRMRLGRLPPHGLRADA